MATNCLICGDIAQETLSQEAQNLRCTTCGDYAVSQKGDGEKWMPLKDADERVKLSGWVRDQNDDGVTPEFTIDRQKSILKATVPLSLARAERLFRYFARKHPSLRIPQFFAMFERDGELRGRTYSENFSAILELFRILEAQGFVTRPKPDQVLLTAKGLIEAEGGPSRGRYQGFVAMSFGKEYEPAYFEGICVAIKRAGYTPLRIDKKEYVGAITDEMLSEIRGSRFVVVDYSGHRNNVYYEAGYATGMDIPVIPTCRVEDAGNLHFDVQNSNTITWASTTELAKKLENRICAVLGDGPLRDEAQ